MVYLLHSVFNCRVDRVLIGRLISLNFNSAEDRVRRVPGTENVFMIGPELFGITPGSSYLIDSENTILVETGTSRNTPDLLKRISDLGVESLDYIAVTHIHLDHAGGAGYLLEEFPEARIIVHERGAEHLVDPSVLKKSAREAIGELFDYYGEIKPVPRGGIISVSGGEKIDLGGYRELIPIDCPGHAPHHLCYYYSGDEILFTGDAAGIYYSERNELHPTTPPPNFDLEKSLKTLKNLRRLDLSLLAYTHWGWSNTPRENLRVYGDILSDWVEEVEEARDDLGESKVVELMIQRHVPEWIESEEERLFFGEMVKMDTRGVLDYLGRKE